MTKKRNRSGLLLSFSYAVFLDILVRFLLESKAAINVLTSVRLILRLTRDAK